MQRIDAAQRRARLAWRHRLAAAARAADPVDVVDALIAVHATDPGSAHLGIAARLRAPAVSATEHALYERRALVRMLAMRRTMFIVPTNLVGVVHAACASEIADRERRQFVKYLASNDIDEEWLTRIETATMEALSERRQALAADLAKDVPELRREIDVGTGRWATTLRVSSRVLFVLAARGHIVRGRPRGTWLSSQYHWVPTDVWLDAHPAAPPAAAARVEVARRWLAAFGPGTVDDLKWWTGWTMTRTRAALAQLDTVDVDLGGHPGLVLAGDTESVPAPDPWAALLPGLDSTPMGWTRRAWYLGDHRDALFDRSGNVGPTVWWNGRIVGGWAQRSDGEIVYRLLEDVGSDADAAIEDEAARLATCIGDVRVTPRFRTPLERDLSA